MNQLDMAQAWMDRRNDIASSWTKETRALLKAEGVNLGVEATGELLKRMRYVISKHYGVADVLSLKMRRYGIFAIKGVGRGVKATTAHLSSRKPKDFYSPIIEKQLEKLEQQLLDAGSDIILNHHGL